MLAQAGLQSLELSLEIGATLLELALFGFAVVQADTQRVTLGMQMPGALHQLPDAGGELVEVLQHGRYRKPSGNRTGLFTQAEKHGNIR
ncbi:Uncharacterised protein [Bordetella pertussis]|nr:Uncharacterised protein [Bordetella pertussis]CFU86781.1 Uncharacterised protein [Bordetella pertussis]CPL79478.1 Uncharacterised protein [Bordetella pertussis]CPM21401.1 Uncharacterised protein [Bordetella pertussis]CPN74651.1 Uncharacterised protein [Bordetella pertussis]